MKSEVTGPIIDLVNVSAGFPNKSVLNSLSLSVARGEMVIVEGATGSGKTTLVRVLLGAQPVQSGYVHILGHDLMQSGNALTKLRRSMGVVFQAPRFLEQESVLTNVSVPLAIAGASRRRCRSEGTRSLLNAGLSAWIRKRPHQLSGGEQARLQIARALIHQPYIVFADEPFAHLDPESAAAAEALLATAHDRGTTVLITTHRPTTLAARATRYRFEDGHLIRLK